MIRHPDELVVAQLGKVVQAGAQEGLAGNRLAGSNLRLRKPDKRRILRLYVSASLPRCDLEILATTVTRFSYYQQIRRGGRRRIRENQSRLIRRSHRRRRLCKWQFLHFDDLRRNHLVHRRPRRGFIDHGQLFGPLGPFGVLPDADDGDDERRGSGADRGDGPYRQAQDAAIGLFS